MRSERRGYSDWPSEEREPHYAGVASLAYNGVSLRRLHCRGSASARDLDRAVGHHEVQVLQRRQRPRRQSTRLICCRRASRRVSEVRAVRGSLAEQRSDFIAAFDFLLTGG
jgi:hypothetical protein